jgi:hypothetical protein
MEMQSKFPFKTLASTGHYMHVNGAFLFIVFLVSSWTSIRTSMEYYQCRSDLASNYPWCPYYENDFRNLMTITFCVISSTAAVILSKLNIEIYYRLKYTRCKLLMLAKTGAFLC